MGCLGSRPLAPHSIWAHWGTSGCIGPPSLAWRTPGDVPDMPAAPLVAPTNGARYGANVKRPPFPALRGEAAADGFVAVSSEPEAELQAPDGHRRPSRAAIDPCPLPSQLNTRVAGRPSPRLRVTYPAKSGGRGYVRCTSGNSVRNHEPGIQSSGSQLGLFTPWRTPGHCRSAGGERRSGDSGVFRPQSHADTHTWSRPSACVAFPIGPVEWRRTCGIDPAGSASRSDTAA